MRKHRDIKLVTPEARRNDLVSDPNYYMTIFFGKFVRHINVKNTDTNS